MLGGFVKEKAGGARELDGGDKDHEAIAQKDARKLPLRHFGTVRQRDLSKGVHWRSDKIAACESPIRPAVIFHAGLTRTLR
jgi:hypothetical protein